MLAIFWTGCASTDKSGIVAAGCQSTPIQNTDLKLLGITPTVGKITVVRMIGTWCPYCQEDFKQIAEHFKTKKWSPDSVEVFLVAYRSSKETGDTYLEFEKLHSQELGETINAKFLDQTYDQLLKLQTKSGEPLLTGWSGVPFGLVFGKDGRLAFRGHFTMSSGFQDNHYAFITKLQKESCRP